MAAKKRPSSTKRAATKGAPPAPPEPRGGPFARQEAFREQRTTRLGPKSDTDDRGPGAAARASDRGAGEAAPPPDARKRVIAEYRKRQQAELAQRDAAQAEPPDVAAGDATSGDTRTPDERAEDELLGPPPDDDDDDADHAPLRSAPPAPPLAPPANNWIPIGPSVLRKGQGATLPSTSGRCNGIAIASGGMQVYAAAANGGVWRSDDEGRTWRSLMDAWDLNPTTASSDSLACGSIAIDPSNADRIFVGTGDGNEANFFGVGPVVSTDGGVNWVTEPVAAGSPVLDGTAMNAMAVDPGDGDRVVAGTFNGVYRRQPRAGGGFEWALKTGPSGMISSVVVARTGTTTTFLAAPFSGPVFTSNDGHTWSALGTGFPSSDVGRVGLAVRPTDPSIVYALVAKASDNLIMGVYRLHGTQWKQVSGAPADLFGLPPTLGGQGTYDLAIAVDPNDANRIYLGGSTKASGGEWSGSVYRSSVTSSGSGTATTFSMANTYIGASVHADIHALAFAPGDSNKLWLGCDGGVFYSTNPTGSGNVFEARNTGLQTMTMNKVDHHPTEDAVVFAGTQDNGGARFTGEEAWYHSVWGDAGEFVINWSDPYRILATYVRKSVNRTTDGGTRYNYAAVNVPAATNDNALFYAPLAGTPPSATAADASRVAFGARRVWISETFGGSWSSIPSNNDTDDLGARISALRFASATMLYSGTTNGLVYRFTRAGTTWTRTRIDNATGGALPLAGWVRSIAVDPSDATGSSIYVAFAGTGDFRHVWRFDGTGWAARSGPSAGNVAALLDVQHNAIVCDPANPSTVYVGADIGVWRSTDGGVNWAPFSAGLPDAAVLDLDLHHPRRLLRASTYGRGVFEYRLDASEASGIELYVRDTQLDQGRFATTNFLNDPTAQGTTVRHWAGPDIKLDTPDGTGAYQFPITAGTTIDFEQFTNVLSDDARQVATHATATITTRVYVQVHNRGVTPASNVRVMCLLANASAALPNLPAGFAANVQSGTPITTPDWRTIGVATVSDVRPGFPRIAAFDLPSSLLPPPTSLAGNDHHCVLALVHHADDPFTASQTITDLLSVGERKAAHKNLKVVEFTGTLPAPPPIMMALRVHNPSQRRALLTTLLVRLNGYGGAVTMFLPRIRTKGDLVKESTGFGLAKPDRFEVFVKWAGEHVRDIERSQASEHPYDKEWCEQRIADVHLATEAQTVLTVTNAKEARLGNLVLDAGARHTVFVAFERPPKAEIGMSFPVQLMQIARVNGQMIGGLDARIDITKAVRRSPAPRRAAR